MVLLLKENVFQNSVIYIRNVGG